MENILEKQQKDVTRNTNPQNPFMAPNDWSNVHCDAYQSDSYTCVGPGINKLDSQRFPLPHEDKDEKLISLLIEPQEFNIVTVGGWKDEETYYHELLLLNRNNLTTLASVQLNTSGNEGGGAYFYLDNNNRVVVGVSNTILCYEISYANSTPVFNLIKEIQIGVSSLVSFLPDWQGNLWYVGKYVNVSSDGTESIYGIVGVVPEFQSNPKQEIVLRLDNEYICNSFAVDEDGGVYIVSDHALYRFDYEAFSSNNNYSWRQPYNRGRRVKPGQYVQGSGTTPTLIDIEDKNFVAITDNADPQMNVVVCRREINLAANDSRQLCEVPVFPHNHSCSENSLIAVKGTLIVENNYGYNPNSEYYQNQQTIPGLTRLFINLLYSPQASQIGWNRNDLSVPSVISKVSTRDNHIYTYTMEVIEEVDHWFFTVLSLNTGETLCRVNTGEGSRYNNHYSGITLDPTSGDAYIPVVGGVVRVRSNE